MKSKIEISAGGIVYQTKNNKISILLIKDPKNKWTFPKGLIETGEQPISTAKREIEEEAGITEIHYKNKLGMVNYVYTFKDVFIRKTVYYYLFEAQGVNNPVAQQEEGISEAKFFPLNIISEIIGYQKTNVPVLKKAKEILKNL